MKIRTDDEFIKTCQLMCRLGITISICGGGKNMIDGTYMPTEIVISANHLFDILTQPQRLEFHDLIDRELIASLSIKELSKVLTSTYDIAKFDNAAGLLKELDIPFTPIIQYPGGLICNGTVSAFDLYDIFSDKEKLQVLSSKLKEKKCGNIL